MEIMRHLPGAEPPGDHHHHGDPRARRGRVHRRQVIFRDGVVLSDASQRRAPVRSAATAEVAGHDTFLQSLLIASAALRGQQDAPRS